LAFRSNGESRPARCWVDNDQFDSLAAFVSDAPTSPLLDAADSKRQRSHIVPLYSLSGNAPELVGSGFLLRTRDHELLISAAHVFAHYLQGPLFIPIGDNAFCALSESFTFSAISMQAAFDETKPDIGFMVLTPAIRDKLAEAGWGFVVTCDTAIARNVQSFDGKVGAIQGFPNEKNRLGHRITSVLVAFPFYSDRTLTRFGFDPAKFIGVRFQHEIRDSETGRETLWPECMSGGPIWLVEGERLRLVGVIAQYYASRSLLLGTRIDLLLRYLDATGIDTSDAPV
jgi:hypothetical protein